MGDDLNDEELYETVPTNELIGWDLLVAVTLATEKSGEEAQRVFVRSILGDSVRLIDGKS